MKLIVAVHNFANAPKTLGKAIPLQGLTDPEGYVLAQWFRHCATNWKVAGSIPDGVIGIFH
jgi:hypothetical protein